MKLYTFKRIAPLAALVMSLGMGSCVGDLDVTPIDPSTVMTPNYNSLFAKCYANIALAGNSGPDGDCDVAGLDGGTTGFVRQLWNANELTTDEAICSWGDEGIPRSTSTNGEPAIRCCAVFTTACTSVLLCATTFWRKWAITLMPCRRRKSVSCALITITI